MIFEIALVEFFDILEQSHKFRRCSLHVFQNDLLIKVFVVKLMNSTEFGPVPGFFYTRPNGVIRTHDTNNTDIFCFVRVREESIEPIAVLVRQRMNVDAHMSIAILVLVDCALLWILQFYSSSIDTIDRVIIFFQLMLHAGIYYGVYTKDLQLIKALHWGVVLYIVVAPFFVTSLVGKWLYTCLILSQILCAIAFNRCVVSHIRFSKEDQSSEILPKCVPPWFYVIIEMCLIVIIWTKNKLKF